MEVIAGPGDAGGRVGALRLVVGVAVAGSGGSVGTEGAR